MELNLTASVLQCGMAKPWPRPVEYVASRAHTASSSCSGSSVRPAT